MFQESLEILVLFEMAMAHIKDNEDAQICIPIIQLSGDGHMILSFIAQLTNLACHTSSKQRILFIHHWPQPAAAVALGSKGLYCILYHNFCMFQCICI